MTAGWIGRLERLLGILSAAGLLLLMVIVTVDVIARNVLNRPLHGGTELLEILLAATIFLLYPVLALRDGHVTVDLIPVPRRLRWFQRVLVAVVGAAVFGLVAWCMARQAVRAAGYGEATALLGVPLSLVLGGMAALAGVTALAYVVGTKRTLRRSSEPSLLVSREVV